jgi:hypothetical protein
MIHASTFSACGTVASQRVRARATPRIASKPMRAQRTVVAQAQAQAQAPVQESCLSTIATGWQAHRAAMAPVYSFVANGMRAGAQYAGRQLALLLAAVVAVTSYLSIQQLQLPSTPTSMSTSVEVQTFAEPLPAAAAPTARQAVVADVEVGDWAMLAEGGNACLCLHSIVNMLPFTSVGTIGQSKHHCSKRRAACRGCQVPGARSGAGYPGQGIRGTQVCGSVDVW